MLSEFYTDNNIACEILYKQLKNSNISHAYIIETNNYNRGYDFALAFAKSLLCPEKYINNELCGNCTQCDQIEDNNNTELEIIEPEGMWIKKEQLNTLQKNFSTKSLVTQRKVYIINQAEKMNESAANSILKFLEEPENNIVAILVVDNAELLLDTISSRCQKIKLINKKSIVGLTDLERVINYLFDDQKKQESFIQSEQSSELLESVLKFAKSIEMKKKETIFKENVLCSLILKDKQMFQYFFKILVLIYNEALNYTLNKQETIFKENNDIIKLISGSSSIDILSKKILLILKVEERLKYNCNLNLVLDKLILVLEGV